METYRMNGNTVRICGKTKETEQGLMLVSSGAFLEFSGEIGNIHMKMAGSDGERYYDAYLGIFLNGRRTLEEEAPLTDILMPEVFEKSSSEVFVPEVIAVNLGTNDASYTRGDATKEAAFTEHYAAFVKKLAKRYPDAYILLLYGLMETTLTEAVKKAEEQCRKDGVKCSFTELPLSDKQDGYGTGEHPSAITHKKTALVAARAIAQVTGWKE